MRTVVSIQGGMAAGKTTLVRGLEAIFKDVYVNYDNPYPVVRNREQKKLDLYTESGFVQNQKLFIENEIKRYKALPDRNIIFDRGPVDTLFYTLYYPKANGFDWDIETLLKDELSELRQCTSDLLIYLDASEETLLERKNSDSIRKRNSFNNNMKLFKYEKTFYQQFNTVMIDVNNKPADQVKREALNLLGQYKF